MLELLKVLHGRPIAPSGLDATKYPLALDGKLLQQQQERTTKAVAARYYSFEAFLVLLFLITNHVWEKKCPPWKTFGGNC